MQELSEKVISKFWERVAKGEKSWDCWIWNGHINPGGALILQEGEEFLNAKRISIILNGRIPTSNRYEYTCGNKRCVNPLHLVCGDIERFWSKVVRFNDGCWYWTGLTNGSTPTHQYGMLRVRSNGRNGSISAHKFSWELHMGRPVPRGAVIMHKCDNTRCVNPAHLSLGTVQDNNQDRDDKGRQAKGEKHGRTKLTEAQVKEIRELSPGLSQRQLSDQFGVARQVIAQILQRKIWKHV